MTLLYNHQLNTVENVPEDKVDSVVASGMYSPRKGVQIPVISPEGVAGYLPSENAQSAFLQGFKYQTSAMSRAQLETGIEQAKEEAYGTSTATALGAGALRGATFGLSDVAMTSIGGKDVGEALLETRERQPTASTIGEIGGGLASLATGLSPTSAVAGLGERTAAAVAAKSTAGKIASEIMAKGAGSAVEGAFYGAGELLTEAALGDPKLTAENAALVFGGNVLGGGIVGGLIPGAATAVGEMKDKLGKILVEDMNVPAKAMDAFGKLISFAKISDPAQQAELKHLVEPTLEGRARRELVLDLAANPEKAAEYMHTAVKEATELGKYEEDALLAIREGHRESIAGAELSPYEAKEFAAPIADRMDKAYRQVTGKMPEQYKTLIKEQTIAESAFSKANTAHQDAIQKMADFDSELAALRTRANELKDARKAWRPYDGIAAKESSERELVKVEERLQTLDQKRTQFKYKLDDIAADAQQKEAHFVKTQKAASEIPTGLKSDKEGAARYIEGTGFDIRNAVESFRENVKNITNKSDLHDALYVMRKDIDRAVEKYRGSPEVRAKNTLELLTGVRNDIQKVLSDENLFGKYGRAFRDADAALSEYYTAAKEMRKTFEKKVAAPGVGSEYQVSRGKTAGLIKSPTSTMAQDKGETLKRLQNAIDSMSSMSAQFTGDTAAFDALSRTTAAMRERVEKIRNAKSAAILLDKLEHKTGRSMLASVVGAGLGGVAGELGMDNGYLGVMGGLAGGALLANPKTVMTYLMRLERGNHTAANAIDESARRLLGIQVPASVKGATANLWAGRKIGINEIARALRETPEPNDEYRSDVDLLKTRAQPLEQIDRMDMQVKNQHPLLDDIAPNVYANAVNSRMSALVYVKSKFPKDREELFAGQSLMSTSQKISLNRSIAAAFNPSELIHEMAEGDVRPETVDAVRTVYPAMFAQVQSKVAELLADPVQQKKIDRAKRIQLAKILGIPTTTATAHIDMLQASWAAPEAQPTPETGRSQMAQAMQTDTEASQFRRMM